MTNFCAENNILNTLYCYYEPHLFQQMITGVSILYVFLLSDLRGRIDIFKLRAQKVLSEKKKSSVHVEL